MISFQNLIKLNRESDFPIFLQISNGITLLIKSGVLAKGMKLPGTRLLSESLSIHRKTAVAAYDELMSQGWIEVIPSRGTFVSNKLPIIAARKIDGEGIQEPNRQRSGFDFYPRTSLQRNPQFVPSGLTLDEGVPDVRIAPVDEIIRHQKSFLSRSYNKKHLSYGPVYGDELLREVLADYLQETRGMNITKDNVIITRGSQMGMYLSAQMILKPGDKAVIGRTNYIAANLTMEDAGASILRVPVDENGLDTNALEKLCRQEKIKGVYVTSHHHHPTTVTLSAERRLHLVQLAEKYRFAILEDDYDYDFHYQNAPLLPLASADRSGNVVYMGAICKIVAPAYRIGYMVASTDLIRETAHLRRIIDRQGDAILERAIALMIQQGDFQRHSKKALKLYKERRDHFCDLLREKLGDYVQFQKPEGGMAVWVGLAKSISWDAVTRECNERGLKIPNWKIFDQIKEGHNHIRMGFASINKQEQIQVVEILEQSIRTVVYQASKMSAL